MVAGLTLASSTTSEAAWIRSRCELIWNNYEKCLISHEIWPSSGWALLFVFGAIIKKSGGLSTDRYKLYPQPARERESAIAEFSIKRYNFKRIATNYHATARGRPHTGWVLWSFGWAGSSHQSTPKTARWFIDWWLLECSNFPQIVNDSPSQPRWPRGRTCPRRTACSPRGCPAGSSSWPSDGQRW